MIDLALTVMIPTRDRWKLLLAQVRSVHEELSRHDLGFEILVHDNSSRDPPAETMETLPPSVRYVRAAELYDTAEENIHAALAHCRGRFIWLLADDDGLEPAGVSELVRRLRQDTDDILVFNSRHGRDERLAGEGPYITERSRRIFHDAEMRCTIGQFVQRTGFYYWICGISTVIVRREIADRATLAKYINIARIYAHVAWLLEVGRGRNFVFVNRPLVVYGLLPTDHDGGRHWRNVGVREGGYENSVWTGLWLRVVEELIRTESYSLEQLRRTIDMSHETRFHWPSNYVYQVIDQYSELDSVMPLVDVELTSRWLRLLFPGLIFLLALVDEMAAFTLQHGLSLRAAEAEPKLGQKVRMLAADLRKRAAWWKASTAAASWWSRLYVETVSFYDIYDFGDEWVATHVAFGGFREALEIIDLPSLPPMFLKAADYEALMAEIGVATGDSERRAGPINGRLDLPNPWGRLEPTSDRIVAVPVRASPSLLASSSLKLPPTGGPGAGDVGASLRVEELEQELEAHKATLQAVLDSDSWRFAAPLRWLGGLFRRGGA